MSEVSSGGMEVAKVRHIRDCGFNESWLQDQIFRNPVILGLGELEPVEREKTQAYGARLDILLKNPEDDSMYEVELMLGETDERHIIRTIEYWDNERRRWPQRQHFAVLVAERVSRRFFNIIYLLGQNIPIMAIQANIIEVAGVKALVFTTILNVYEEPEDSPSGEVSSEDAWKKTSPNTLVAAQRLLEIVRPIFPNAALSFGVISIVVKENGKSLFLLYKRKTAKIFRLVFRVDETDMDDVIKKFDSIGVVPARTRGVVRVTIHQQALETNPAVFVELAKMLKSHPEALD